MKRDNACRIVAGSSLMQAIRRRHGSRWTNMPQFRSMLAHYAYELEREINIDGVLDEMEEVAGEISGDAAAA